MIYLDFGGIETLECSDIEIVILLILIIVEVHWWMLHGYWFRS